MRGVVKVLCPDEYCEGIAVSVDNGKKFICRDCHTVYEEGSSIELKNNTQKPSVETAIATTSKRVEMSKEIVKHVQTHVETTIITVRFFDGDKLIDSWAYEKEIHAIAKAIEYMKEIKL